MLLVNVIFWVGLVPVVISLPIGNSCDADDCRIGTATVTGACGIGAAIGGAALCVTTAGLGCLGAAGVGAACAAAGAIGDTACGKCEADSYPDYTRNFEQLNQKMEDIKTNLKEQKRWFQELSANDRKQLLNQQSLIDGQRQIIGNQQNLIYGQKKIIGNQLEQFEELQKLQRGQEIILEFQLKNLDWFRQLDKNDQTILKNQASLISLQENTLGMVNEVLSATDKISSQIDKNQILTIYGDTLLYMANIKRYYNRLSRKGNLIINDRRAFLFRDFALDPREGSESNINNIFTMLHGGGPLNTPSIYEKLGSEYCKPETYQYFLELQYESLLMYSIALAMEGHSVSQPVIKNFKQDLIRSTAVYIRNCGCPENFMKSRRGEVSTLLQNLPESRESIFQNFVKVASIENELTRIKISRILELKNIDVNENSIQIVEEHPWEDIDIIVQFTKTNKSEDLVLHNFAEICIDMDKNDACEVLWIHGHGSQTIELPDLNPVLSDYEVADPAVSYFQKVEGKVYGCSSYRCQQYFPEENTWTTIQGPKLVSMREWAAETLIEGKWVVQGGYVFGEVNGKWQRTHVPTAEVWTPGAESWVEAPEYKSPLPLYGHCLVTLKDKIFQIGGYSLASRSKTSRCFLDGKEVASLKAPRFYHACAVFQGQVWVAGGERDPRDGGDHDVVEIYDPSTDTWREGPRRPTINTKYGYGYDWNPRLHVEENTDQLYYIGGRYIGKIYRLSQNKDGWEEVAKIKEYRKSAAIVMKKWC